MSNISHSADRSKSELQEWADAISFGLSHIPAGYQLDLAHQLVDAHKPGAPEFAMFNPDRGELMLWASAQPAQHVAMMLEECLLELGKRNVSENVYKRLLKMSWDAMSDESRGSFLKWAAQEGEI